MLGFTRQWYVYYRDNGEMMLTYPDYGTKYPIPCPHCGSELVFEKYTAECCNKTFKTGWYKCRQVEPVGNHSRRYPVYVPYIDIKEKEPLY